MGIRFPFQKPLLRRALDSFQNILKDTISQKHKPIAKKLILSNIPPELRPKVWLLSSGAERQIKDNPYYYSSLCELAARSPSLYKRQIEADLNRTDIPGSTPSEKEENKNHLKQILTCFALRNSSIGYCQGFNFIVRKLFLITQDEV